jgi:phosphate transport system permease protein
MTEPGTDIQSRWSSPEMKVRIARRHAAEKRFRRLGIAAIAAAVGTLAILLVSIVWNGYSAFFQTQIRLDVFFDPAELGPLGGIPQAELDRAVNRVDFAALVRGTLREQFPAVEGRRDVHALQSLVSVGARRLLRDMVLEDRAVIGKTVTMWLPADDEVDMFAKGRVSPDAAESERRLDDAQIGWIETLRARGDVRTTFNWGFFTSGDSREPELAGIWGAVVGSALTLLVTLAIVFPLGVSAALYLEEFAPQNRWTDLIEVNINNLAAVPSVVFGLLGLAVFLDFFDLPRSAPLVGGMTLALMTLPTIIIASRAAIKAVPPSIREAARGLGASPLQVVTHHVLPLARPGILTGTIIGLSQALGETAPLLMIGMVAFVVDIPGSLTEASSALPVQIYLWADSPERGFVEKTSGAIMVLLAFLIAMNGTAIWLRHRFEKRW